MKQIRSSLWLALILLFARSYSQTCGGLQTLSSLQNTQLSVLYSQLDAALAVESVKSVDSLSVLILSLYGDQAGLPEKPETYVTLNTDTAWVDFVSAVKLSRKLVDKDSTIYRNLWKLGKGMKYPEYPPHSIYLRTSAEWAVGLLRIAQQETNATRKADYILWAKQALDTLAAMQLSSGAFPFPDLRTYDDPLFGPQIQKFLNALGVDSAKAMKDGWLVDDFNQGLFLFDAGVIGSSYFDAYHITGDTVYRRIGRATADYLTTTHLNKNYNYNTFSALCLARAYQMTGDTAYLQRAVTAVRLAVLPGQMENGRWADGHNARSVYHTIIISNCTPLISVLPSINPNYTAFLNMYANAVSNHLSYSAICGVSTGFDWLLNAFLLPAGLLSIGQRDSIVSLIGRHIREASVSGRFLDISTMGLYLDLAPVLAGHETKNEENSDSVNLRITPHPVTDEIQGCFSSAEPGRFRLILYGIDGRKIQSIVVNKQESGKQTFRIPGQRLSHGIYFLRLLMGRTEMTVKLLKN